MYVANLDLIAITETWLHDGIASGSLDPESLFNIIRKDRKADVKGGGVCALVKQEAQLSLRDRATRCQLKSDKILHKCSTDCT